jgi:hypothetical protein
MKSILNLFSFTVICIITVSCSTNYYTVSLTEDAKVYKVADSSNMLTIIPKDTQVFLSSKSNRKNYKRIKWKNYSGWAYNPVYTTYDNYTPINSTSSSNYSTGGSVNVKSYYRKDGTYVRSHTRSTPSRRK